MGEKKIKLLDPTKITLACFLKPNSSSLQTNSQSKSFETDYSDNPQVLRWASKWSLQHSPFHISRMQNQAAEKECKNTNLYVGQVYIN
mgnify:CR=1 FL=1